jgi:uncharacterized NAD-dependent epimerase/dehydratase family protein
MTASEFPEGNAIVYCEGAFATTNGKTAHGLVRRSQRYRVLSVVDSNYVGEDAGAVLDGRPSGILVKGDLASAVDDAVEEGLQPTHLVIGLAPDGGRLSPGARADIRRAIEMGLNVDCGLHDFLTEDPEMVALAAEHGVTLRDIRKPPPRSEMHFFENTIGEVDSLKVALLGTDSAVGKRTTAWLLNDALEASGHSSVMVGTGQTAWLQGARYGIVLDSLVNDFIAGEIEHAVWSAWTHERPEVIIVEGQGSLLNPAYPGGFEILAAARPDLIVLQHAPARVEYDGFPGHVMHPLEHQIAALELISGRRVVAITINHEKLSGDEISKTCEEIAEDTGLPVFDVLRDGAEGLAAVVAKWLPSGSASKKDGGR